MLSDNQHIDDFFRKKEDAFVPDNQLATTHWQQFKVPRHELTLEVYLEKPYNASAVHDERSMRYVAITEIPPYALERRPTEADKIEREKNRARREAEETHFSTADESAIKTAVSKVRSLDCAAGAIRAIAV